MAHPADPEPGYGWEKLFAEELCRYYYKDYGFDYRLRNGGKDHAGFLEEVHSY